MPLVVDLESCLFAHRVFEGDPYEITTLCEVEYREQILEQTLKHIRVRKVHCTNPVSM